MQLRLLSLSTSALFIALTPFARGQQQYSARLNAMLLPFTPGAGTEVSARAIGQKVAEVLHQQGIVDNGYGVFERPGAQP